MRYVMIFLMLCGFIFAQSTVNEDTIHFIGQASAFTVGSELITDGDFPDFDNWTQGTWTVAGGVASENNAGGDSDLTQALTNLVHMGVYRIQFEVTAYTDGAVTAVFDGVELGDKTATGVYTGYAVATGTAADLDIRADATFTGSVDNVSVVAWVGDLDAAGGSTIAGFTGTLTDYMTATGGLLHYEAGLATANNTSNKVEVTVAAWDQGGQPKVGTLVNVDFSAALDSGEDDGIYEITAATTTTIDIDADFAAGGADDAITCEIWVGGTFVDIATAVGDASTLSQDPDATYRKRYICVNVNQEVDAVTDFIAETSEAALRGDDGSRKIIGFYDSISVVQPDAGYRIVSDMDGGQTYYAGALTAFQTDESFTIHRAGGKWIEWNAKGNSINILELNTSNFEIRNIKLHNTAIGGTNALLHVDDASISNISFVNCWFAAVDVFHANDAAVFNSDVADCYFDDTIVADISLINFQTSTFTNCIINATGKTYSFSAVVRCFFYSSLFYKGAYGMYPSTIISVNNCIFFDQTIAGLRVVADTASIRFCDTIFSPAATSDNAILLGSGSMTAAAFNNIMYSVTGGGVLTTPIQHDQITPNPPLPVGTLEVDPQFVNPADGDFRLKASSPALNGGVRDLFGGWSDIGANGSYASPNAGYRSRYNFKGHNYNDR